MNPNSAPSYREAGVDLEVGDRLVERLKPLAAQTRTAGVESGLGAFGGFFSFGCAHVEAEEFFAH